MGSVDEAEELASELKDLSGAARELRRHVSALSPLAKEASGKGVSLLDLGNAELLAYTSDLMALCGTRASGKSVASAPSRLRLCRIRTVLERLRPVQARAQHQIQELLSLSSSAKQSLALKPRPGNLASDEEEEQMPGDEEEEEEEKGKKANGTALYVPPKITAQPYAEERSREARSGAEARKERLSRSILAELAEEFGDAPAEETAVNSLARRKRRKEAMERRDYEEANLTRLPPTKKAKGKAPQSAMESALGFGDFMRAAEARERRGGKGGKPRLKGKKPKPHKIKRRSRQK